MEVRTFAGGDFLENTHLVVCGETSACVVVDPGGAAEELAQAITAESLELRAVLLTHAHLDHIEGVNVIRALDPQVPIWLHPADRAWYDGIERQAAMFGLRAEPQPPPDHEFVPGESFEFGGCRLDRDIPAILESAGFAFESLDSMYLPGGPRIASFNYWGTARPASRRARSRASFSRWVATADWA